jgi:chromosome segregation ATPase
MFLQTGSVSVKNSRIFNFLKKRATALKSTALAALALNMKRDHFVKVRGMIKDLVAKLEAQAESEATQKEQCDKDMKAAIEKRDEANINVEQLTTAITTNEAMIAKLTKEIKELNEAMAELRKAKRERTELRNEEKAENESTIADAKEGLDAIKNAITVLKDFYGSAFLQQAPGRGNIDTDSSGPAKDRDGNRVEELRPETFEGDYHGNQDESKGIFGLLDVISSDYDRTISTTEQAESDANQEYEDYVAETDADLEKKEGEKKEKKGKKDDENATKSDNEDDLVDAKEMLKAAKESLEILSADCVDDQVSHEERLARRKDEIESLKEALNILEDMSFLQRH